MVLMQATLLFDLETWVITNHMVKTLVWFHHRVTIGLTWNLPQLCEDWVWYTPPIEDDMREADME